MNIVKMNGERNLQYANVSLDYDEVKHIADSLNDAGHKELGLQFVMLQELMKEGMVSSIIARKYVEAVEGTKKKEG